MITNKILDSRKVSFVAREKILINFKLKYL